MKFIQIHPKWDFYVSPDTNCSKSYLLPTVVDNSGLFKQFVSFLYMIALHPKSLHPLYILKELYFLPLQ